jgi:hypothetical protein
MVSPGAYARRSADGQNTKYTSVAVVQYAEVPSPKIEKTIQNIEKSLNEQKGVRVLDRKTTNDILSYYLDHVDKIAGEGTAAVNLREAREAYQKAEYDLASRKITDAETNIREGIGNGASNGLLADLLILKAKLAYVQGGKGRVPGIYDEIVALNPELVFPKGLYSRWEHKALDDAKQKIEMARTSSIQIQSDPKSCEVYLNGIHKGVTYYDKPFEIAALPAGEHCVELRTINYETYVDCFNLAQGEKKEILATLRRISSANGRKAATVSPTRFSSAHELSVLVSGLGYYLGVNKVILVHEDTNEAADSIAYQIGDSSLGAVNKTSTINLNAKNGAPLALMTKEMRNEMQRDVLSNPGDQLISQSVGSIQLHEKRRKPLYKRPIFWVLVGAGAAAGGITAVILGAGAAAATTGGIIIGL